MCITCDNASNNDTMITHLAKRLPAFQGTFHRVRCFAHVIQLVAKSLLRSFDAKHIEDAEAVVDKDIEMLLRLAEDMASEDAAAVAAGREEEGEDAPLEDDEDWVDEIASLSIEEQAEFEQELVPVKLVLAKVGGALECRTSILTVTTSYLGSEVIFQGHQFDYNFVACMA